MDVTTIALGIVEAADSVDDYYTAVPHAGEWKAETAYFVPSADTAADGSNYVQVELFNGSDSLGSFDTSSTGLTEGTPRAISLSGGDALEFTGGTDAIKAAVTHPGTGAAIEGELVLGFRKINDPNT